MIALTGFRIKTTTYQESYALQSFYSYTLENTPFYFRPVWNALTPEDFKKNFTENLIVWDFGDGTYYTGPTAQHFYKWPGTYNVKATILDIEGNTRDVFIDEPLNVFNALPDVVTMGGLDTGFRILYSLPAGRRTDPLKFYRYNSWQYDRFLKDTGYTINLYASGSNSNYISVSSYYTSQWAHLKAYFGFIERTTTRENVLSEKLVESTKTTSVSVYAKKINTGNFDGNWDLRLRYYSYPEDGTVFCGTSGTELPDREIFFVDQKPSGEGNESLVILYATFDNNIIKDISYYNTNITTPYGIVNNTWSTQLVKSLYNSASSLAVTSTGITQEGSTDRGSLTAQSVYTFDIFPIKFTNTNIPFVVTFKDVENFTTKCYPLLNLNNSYAEMKINDIRVSLMEIFRDGSFKRLDEAYVEPNASVPRFSESGSYFAGLLKYPKTTGAVSISAIAYINDAPFNPPSKSVAYVMQPGLNVYRKYDKIYKYGYGLVGDSFKAFENAQTTTINADISGGINITYVPGYMVNSLSGEYVWITNADRDKIVVHNGRGESIFPDINLRRLPLLIDAGNGRTVRRTTDARGGNNSASPCNIAIDSNGDAWVTLYDSVTSYKIDKSVGIAKAFIIPNIEDSIRELDFQDYKLYTQLKGLKGFVGENLILPTSVDIDKSDNVYISYTHPLSSFVSKYNSVGKMLKIYPFAFPFTVKQLLLDLNDNIWITTFSNDSIESANSPQSQKITDRKDRIYCINQRDSEIRFIESSMPGDMTMDIYGFVWINSRNNTVSRLLLDGRGLISKEDYTIGSESEVDYVQDLGGIAGDMNGSLLLINNTESSLMYFNAKSPASVEDSSEIPSVSLPDTGKIDTSFNSYYYYKTIGDFTGIRWFLKNSKSNANVPRFVTGRSGLFTIASPTNVIVKKNENYDLANTIKSYVLQESLFNNNNLFDNFFAPILNGNINDLDELGKVIYEKIANYVDNISDVDKCNLKSLKSMYNMIGEDLDLFLNTVPPSIRRLIDILSVKKCILYGNKNNFDRNFSEICVKFDPNTNLGEELKINKDYFIPGYPVIVYEKFTKNYKLIQNTLINEHGVELFKPYPLSGISYDWGWGLVLGDRSQMGETISNYYKIYNYIPTSENNFYDGLIDFKDSITSISPYVSSYKDWTKYGGTMDNIISANLYQNLGLIKP